MFRSLPFGLLFVACSSPTPGPWSITHTAELTADHVVAADLDGDGSAEIGTVVGDTLTIGGRTHSLAGSFQRTARRPGPGGDALLVATGQGRGHREAAAVLTEITRAGERQLWTSSGARNQITDLRVVGERSWVTAYADARKVSGGWLRDGKLEAVTEAHMGQRQLPLANGSVVVARVYGEAPKSPGDLQLHPPGAPARPLTSLRGARALAAVDLDGDGVEEVIAGDGWHYAYGKEADPRIVVHSGPQLEQSRVIGWVPDSYAALEIVPVGTGPSAALVVQGSERVVLLQRDVLGWGLLDLGAISEVGDIAVVEEGARLKVAIGGKGARLLTLERRP